MTISIYDAGGKLQFNSSMLTYALRASGSANAENLRVGNTSPQSVSLPLSANYPNAFAALSGGSGYGAAFAGRRASNGQLQYATNAPAGTSFQYYLFERSEVVPSSGFGLEVRNEFNQITFSSNQRTMPVVNIIGLGQNHSAPGRRLAFWQGAFAGHSHPYNIRSSGGGGGPTVPEENPGGGSAGGYDYSVDGKVYGARMENSDSFVRTMELSYDDVQARFADYPDFGWTLDLNLFIVDVTNYPTSGVFF